MCAFALISIQHDVWSPFIVPVAACAMVAVIVIANVAAGTRRREVESQERLAAIARGVAVPPTVEEMAIMHGRPTTDLVRRRANIRLTGIVLLGVAVGLILFFIALATVLQQRAVLCGAAVGLIPLAIGGAFLVDARIQSREIQQSGSGGPGASPLHDTASA